MKRLTSSKILRKKNIVPLTEHTKVFAPTAQKGERERENRGGGDGGIGWISCLAPSSSSSSYFYSHLNTLTEANLTFLPTYLPTFLPNLTT